MKFHVILNGALAACKNLGGFKGEILAALRMTKFVVDRSYISTVREESHDSEISRSLQVESKILGKVRPTIPNYILYRSTPGDYHR